MSVLIKQVADGSPAQKAGLQPGDTLLTIGQQQINDVLDYRFFMTDKNLRIQFLRQGIPYSVGVKKAQYDELGLEFDSYLMDEQRSCKNHCIFCFIDQNPKGMRKTVYFKDDDDRLSFLFGNYITLTNLTDHDVERIISMKISPINVSIHTTDPLLRVEMMRNPNAGQALDKFYRLAQAGVKLNTQLVLCPNINDRDALRKSLTDLGKLFPSIQSIACVPVGVTAYRKGLYPLSTYTPSQAGEVIDIIEEFSTRWLSQQGERIAYPSDEFFLKAGREIPCAEYYGEFDQLDNGVGMIACCIDEFNSTLPLLEPTGTPRSCTLVTGTAAYPTISGLAAQLTDRDPALTLWVKAVPSRFFGPEITVAGLITGSDIITELKGFPIGDCLVIPACMLRHERDRFLDDMTLEELADHLSVPIKVIETDGAALAELLEQSLI